VLCEGQPQGRDLRLLERVRSQLERNGVLDWLRAVRFVPAGGKSELRGQLKARSRIHATQPIRIAAIRDRDFLRAADALAMRAEAVKPGGEQAWPLSRHSIESYLLEPELLESVGVPAAVAASLPELASHRLWYDLACSSVEVVRLLANRERLQIAGSPATIVDRNAAVDAARRATVAWQDEVNQLFGHGRATIEAQVDADAIDFRADPLVHRVHGKKLLAEVEKRSRLSDLGDRLVRHVERNTPPRALADDLRLFLQQLQASF